MKGISESSKKNQAASHNGVQNSKTKQRDNTMRKGQEDSRKKIQHSQATSHNDSQSTRNNQQIQQYKNHKEELIALLGKYLVKIPSIIGRQKV